MRTGINGHTEERLKNFNENQRRKINMEKLQVILYPECISYKTRRTGSRRLIELRRRDANDENDGSDSIQK
jgi:hypothetical protein